MKTRRAGYSLLTSFATILTGCGALGPPLGLGPALDQFVGLLLLVGLILAGSCFANIDGRRAIRPEKHLAGREQRYSRRLKCEESAHVPWRSAA
jgi:hypothetical protein